MTLYSAYLTRLMILPTTILVLLAIAEENIDEIANFILQWKIILLAFQCTLWVVLFLIGRVELGAVYEVSRYRMNIGFNYPTMFADYVLDITILLLFCKRNNLRKRELIVAFSLTMVAFFLTNARAVLVWSVLLIIIFGVAQKTQIVDKPLSVATRMIVPILTIFMWIAIHLYSIGNKWGYRFDSLLNSRVRLNGYLSDMYGISFFGQRIHSYSGDISYRWLSRGGTFDCTYIWLMVEWGCIWLILLFIAFYKIGKLHNKYYNVLLVIWALNAMTDTSFMNGISSFPILLFSMCLSNDYCSRKRKGNDSLLYNAGYSANWIDGKYIGDMQDGR